MNDILTMLQAPNFHVFESEYHLSKRLSIAEKNLKSAIDVLGHAMSMLKLLTWCSMEKQFDYVSTWSRIVSICAQELKHCTSIWEQALHRNVQSQVLLDFRAREDELVVMIVPDFQMLEYVERFAADLSDDPPRPLIMWNPRLISAEVGVGFNVRNLKCFFLRTFTTVYSMKPLPPGAVFRCYPGSWKVFYDDKDRTNRYLLAKELIGRPDTEDLEIIFGDEEEKSESGGPSLFSKAAGIFCSIIQFMKAM